MTATIASVAHELAKRLLADRRPTEARTVLAKARTVRSTNEAIWRDLAQVEADVENLDALRRVHDAYFDECDNLGIQPDPETAGTIDRLLNEGQMRTLEANQQQGQHLRTMHRQAR